MVASWLTDPVLLLALPFGVAFLLPLLHRLGAAVSSGVHLLVLIFGTALSLAWLLDPAMNEGIDIVTGGWAAPWGIVLHFGGPEATLTLLAYGSALIGALFLLPRLAETGVRGLVLQLMVVVGAVGLILSRDLFNIFVFIEIAGIGTYALVLFGPEKPGLEAGFKYLLMGGLASALILIGTGLLYYHAGTLYLDDMARALAPQSDNLAVLTVFGLLLAGMFAELKLAPVNGPAVDLYHGADPGAMALIVGTVTNAMLWAFVKVYGLFPEAFFAPATMAVGMTTYVASNLIAVRQDNARRLMGYSSSAQMGLLVFVVPLFHADETLLSVVLLLLVNHTLAKAGLLWLAGALKGAKMSDWRGLMTTRPGLGLAFVVLVLAIAGLPPFPGFWAKWQLLSRLAGSETQWMWIIPLLVGAFLEMVYYFNWLKHAFTAPETAVSEDDDEAALPHIRYAERFGPLLTALLLVGGGMFTLAMFLDLYDGNAFTPALLLLGCGVVLAMARAIPHRIRGLLALAALGATGYALWGWEAPNVALAPLFLVLTFAGAGLALLGSLAYKRGPGEYHGLFLILVAAMVLVFQSLDPAREGPGLIGLFDMPLMTFFAAWEIMTWATALLISRGSARAGFLYMLFSGAAGFLILGGLMAGIGAGGDSFHALARLDGAAAMAAWGLLALGVLVKLGAWGFHIWAESAYAESPDDFTPFLSGVVSKAPIFVLLALVAMVGSAPLGEALHVDPWRIVAWIAGLTTLAMALIAAIQEDAKRLLAYSSLGQVAYIVVAIAIATPLGWSAAVYLTINHFLFKMLLFLAIAGVVLRTGTDTMYRLGGLIKKMPVSYVSVMVGIIAVSGVPPLSGFAGKWMIYEALVDRGWLFLAGVVMFATMIAFLYLYRLIQTIFLGQLKDEHKTVTEAPPVLVIPQVVLIVALLVFAVWPQIVLEPLTGLINAQALLPADARPVFAGDGALSFGADGVMGTPLGYFNPLTTMLIVIGFFVVVALFLMLHVRKAKWVKPGDIVYSAEMTPRPEETHYAYDMYKPYRRAWAPLLMPRVTNFWRGAAESLTAVTDGVRKFYTGGAQTYLLYGLFLAVLLALLAGEG